MSAEKTVDLRAKLKDKGLKMTPQRQAVLDALFRNEGRHLTTEEVFESVCERMPEIGIATVYRTLDLLDQMGLVYKSDFDDGISRYEVNPHDENHRHHHLICTRCGKVMEAREDLLDTLEEEIQKTIGFRVTDHRVKFYGVCAECEKSEEA